MKRLQKYWKKIAIMMLAFFLITSSSIMDVNANTARREAPVIKIGYINYEGFFSKQPDGSFTGYGMDYLKEISKYTRWNYEFSYDTWENQLKKLKSGEIDFICHAQMTEERKKEYAFAKYSIGVESSVLYVREDDDRYYYNDFTHFNGMKVAMLENSYQNEEFKKYAEEKQFSYESIDYKTVDECFDALNQKQVDAVVIGSLGLKNGYKVVSRVGSDPFYFMTAKKNGALIAKLNDALSEIRVSNPYFEADLYEKYYGEKAKTEKILLTRKENEFVKSVGTIHVALIPDRTPYSCEDKNGNPEGITVDIMNLIAERSGLSVQYDFMPVGVKTADYLIQNPDCFVAGIMTQNVGFQTDEYLLSDVFNKDDVGLVCKKGMQYSLDAPDAAYKLVIPKSYMGLMYYIQNHYPQFEILTGDTNADCMRMVLKGDADFMAQNVNLLRPLLANPHYESLTILPTFFMDEPTGMVCFNSDKNEILMGIMDKAIATITSKEKTQFTVNHTVANSYKPSMGDMIYKFRIPLLLTGILFILCVAILLRFLNYRKISFEKLELKNTQLAEAVAQADNANRAKSSFLARMSHEIRTPMNAIVGITAIAKHHKEEPAKIEEYLEKIETASRVLLNIINDVLDMSAIESDKIKIGKAPFDIKSVLTSIATIYYSQCRQKEINFEMDTAQINHEKLIGDGLRVNQVLLNLISNAYKFTPAGGTIQIIVTETNANDGEAYFKFQVSDTGEGMSEEMQKRLFKPFEQEGADTAQKHGGSGLGLSIAKNLVEMMHGSISFVSKKGEGTTFKVSIPFEIDQNAAVDITEDNLKKIKALIVDDSQETREYTAIILDRIGVPYELAKDGEDALQKMQRAQETGDTYSICFIDWKMPGMNGAEVTKQIREKYSKDMLLIIVSAYDTTEIQEDAIKAGADLFVTKPLFQSSVFNLLMKLSGGQYVNQTADETEYNFEGKKVLLAEDTEFNAEVAIELLDLVHMEVERAENGQMALQMFEKSEPGTYEAILMDVQMPIMDGYEATRAIRALTRPDAKTIPIIAMTANAFTEDISAAINAGMNDHIAKPIDTEVLYSTLKKVVDYSSSIR